MSETILAQSPSTNGHGLKRAILYTRVSTTRQAEEGNSLEQQLDALREFAQLEGYEIIEEVRDAGYSGATLERPGLWRVRELVADGMADVVLVQDRDTLSREPAYHWLLGEEFKKFETVIRTPGGHDDDDSPVGQLTSGILDQVAAFERRFTALRMRRGKLQIAKQGKVLASGTARYGFRFNDARDGYEVDETTMSTVRRIFTMVASGYSLYAVAQTLQQEGIPTPHNSGRWSTVMIRGAIHSDVYMPFSYEEVCALVAPEVAATLDPDKAYGLWRFSGIPVPVPDAGIPREIAEMARERIKDNRRASNAGNRFWPLSGGILRCAECGSALEPNTSGRKGHKMYHYYRCPKSYKGTPRCINNLQLRAKDIEETTWAFVAT